VVAVLTHDGSIAGIELGVVGESEDISPEGEKYKNMQFMRFSMHPQQAFSESPEKESEHSHQEKKPVDLTAHVFVKFEDVEKLRVQPRELDRLLVNRLQELNVEVTLFWRPL